MSYTYPHCSNASKILGNIFLPYIKSLYLSSFTALITVLLGSVKSSLPNFKKVYLPSGNNANGATVSSSSTLTSTYTFNGWYKESGATNKIAGNTTTPALQASTTYTDANNKWINDGAVTLYAGWTAQAKTLPTITKEGYTCGWTTTSTGATTIQYASGGSITPSGNTTCFLFSTTSFG